MKKVGLITYYGENYGGMLQAYALEQFVRQQGYSCRLICNDFLYTIKKSSRKKQLKNNLKGFLKNPVDYMRRRKIMRSTAEQRALKSKYFVDFRRTYLDVDQNDYTCYEQYVQNPPQYDVYLCGSDQIWNPNLYHENGFYFAGFAPDNAHKVSYASSIGVSSITSEQGAFMKPFLERIDVLSTRETDGSAIVEKLTGKPCRTVLDPTLLLNEAQWLEVAAPRLIREPYIFCYIFAERSYIAKVKKQVKAMTGMELVCIPYASAELAGKDRKIYEAGPAEFISLIKHASLVLTDSFHATAFSINLRTPFLSLCRFSKNDPKGMNSRLHTILGAVGLEDRLIDEQTLLTEQMLFDVDFEQAHSNLNRLRKEDGEFLVQALEADGKGEKETQ